MARSSHVPKFGDWNSQGETLYTTVFDNARAGKGVTGRNFNPNDPQDNSEAFPEFVKKDINSAPNKTFETEGSSKVAKRPAKDDSELRNHVGLSANSVSTPRRSAGESHATGRNPSSGGPRVVSGGDKKGPADVGTIYSPSTPGRKSRIAKELNEATSPLPKFGSWNDNPASADGFTYIFNKAREEKQHGGHSNYASKDKEGSSCSYGRNSNNSRNQSQKKCGWCCF